MEGITAAFVEKSVCHVSLGPKKCSPVHLAFQAPGRVHVKLSGAMWCQSFSAKAAVSTGPQLQTIIGSYGANISVQFNQSSEVYLLIYPYLYIFMYANTVPENK